MVVVKISGLSCHGSIFHFVCLGLLCPLAWDGIDGFALASPNWSSDNEVYVHRRAYIILYVPLPTCDHPGDINSPLLAVNSMCLR